MTTSATSYENFGLGQPAPAGFRQQLGLFDATMLVAGSMIGSGIFIVSADISRDVGSSGWLMLVWVLTGVITIIGALSYAELAAMMPNAGGQYVYLREAYSPLWGFLYGWTSFLIIQTGFIAAVSVAFAKFLGVFVPELGTAGSEALLWEKAVNIHIALPVPWLDEPLTFFKRDSFQIYRGQLVALAVTVFLTLLNCLGVRQGKWVQNIFTVAKTAALLFLIAMGLTLAANTVALEQNLSGIWGGITRTARFDAVARIVPATGAAAVLLFCGAMVGALFSADAWGNVTFTAGEVKNPRRNLPLSLGLGVALVIILYVLANAAYLAALPVQGNELEAMKLSARAKEFEYQAAVREADVAHYRAELARTQLAKRQIELDAKLGKVPPAILESRKEELKKLDKFMEILTTDMAKKQAEAEENRQLAQRYLGDAALVRGIDHARDDRVGTAVLERISPRFGVPFMALAIMISTFGCVNGIILTQARLYYAMARDRLFFQSVGKLNQRGVPAVALILQGLWGIVLIFSGSYNELLDYVIFAALVFYVLTVSAVFVLRRKHPEWPRPYRAFGYPVVPALYILLCTVIMLALLVVRPVYSWPSFLIVLTGIPVYLLWRGRSAGRGSSDLLG